MQVSVYESSLLAAASFQLAKMDDVNEILAIACVIRNWVVKDGIYVTYSEAIQNFLTSYAPVRPLPNVTTPALVDPAQGLLGKIEDVYHNRHPDITSVHGHFAGARYFLRAGSASPESWPMNLIRNNPEQHPLLGTWGSQQFYG